MFERTRADGNVEHAGGGRTVGSNIAARFEIAIIQTIVRDGLWIDSKTYFDEGTAEGTAEGFIFRPSVTADFTYQGRRNPANKIVVTTTLGPNSPVRDYTFKRP